MPKSIIELAEALSSLPGIGPKTASRFAVYMATSGKKTANNISSSIGDVLDQVSLCEKCGNLTEESPCAICKDDERREEVIMVVETPLDLIQIENSGEYKGTYVVLGRLISPINGVTPEDTALEKLLRKLRHKENVTEVILALSSTVEGESTSLLIADHIHNISSSVNVTRLAKGLPTGVDIEYLDDETIKGALQGRISV